jgi:hypothetical protein
MSSTAKLAANRSNAKLSTGPRTSEGKTLVARNACKHNLTSINIAIPAEDRRDFEALIHELTLDLKPLSTLEAALVEQAAYAEWKLLRIARWESEIITAALHSAAAHCQKLFGKTPEEALARLHRYESQTRRAWHNTLKELRIQQRIRAAAALAKPSVSKIMQNLLKSNELQVIPENNETNPVAPAPGEALGLPRPNSPERLPEVSATATVSAPDAQR